MRKNIIGKQIVNRRHELNMTQEELAEESNLSINYISRIERGTSQHISAESLYKIAKSLNTTMETLIAGKNSPAKNPGPKQAKLIHYLQMLNLDQSEKLCQDIIDLLSNYHI